MTALTWTISNAYVITEDDIAIACAADVLDDFERLTSIYQWSRELQDIDGSDTPWFYTNFDWRCTAITGLFPEGIADWWLCALSEEGHVHLHHHVPVTEKISGAGVFSNDAVGWGYLADLQQIGDNLYACGYRGQIYRRLGPNDWQHCDDGLLQAPDTPLDQSIALSTLGGPHPNAIYTAGYRHTDGLPPVAFFFNGEHWRELPLPDTAERITCLYVETEERIWMCGSNGTLLLGNANDGFQDLASINDNQLFTSICPFQRQIYLASNLGLYRYDPRQPDNGITRVVTDLKPDLQDANIVGAYRDVLWSIGPKDIARFDGKSWTRLDPPNNPPIR